MIYVPDNSELALLKMMFGNQPVEDMVGHLFVNNKVPAQGDVVTDYTEMTGLGYASIALPKANWTFATNAQNKAEASYPEQSWIFQDGTATTVYGYYVTRATTGDLLWAEVYGTPHVVQYLGDRIKQTFKFSLSTGA